MSVIVGCERNLDGHQSCNLHREQVSYERSHRGTISTPFGPASTSPSSARLLHFEPNQRTPTSPRETILKEVRATTKKRSWSIPGTAIRQLRGKMTRRYKQRRVGVRPGPCSSRLRIVLGDSIDACTSRGMLFFYSRISRRYGINNADGWWGVFLSTAPLAGCMLSAKP